MDDMHMDSVHSKNSVIEKTLQFTVRLSRQFLSHLDVPIHRMETMPQKFSRRKSKKSKTKIRFGISGLLCFLLARSAAEIMSLRLTENAQSSTVSIDPSRKE